MRKIATLSVLAFVLIAALAAGVTFTNVGDGGVGTSSESIESTETPSEEPDEYIAAEYSGYSEKKYGEYAYRYEVMGPDPDDPGTSYISANNVTTKELANGDRVRRENVSFNVSSAEVERWIVYYINQERKERGLEPVTLKENISSYARAHSYLLARHDEIGHLNYNGRQACSSGSEVVVTTKIYENQQPKFANWEHKASSPKRLARFLVERWMISDEHRTAIMAKNPNLNIGAGVYFDKNPNGEGPAHVSPENLHYISGWDSNDIVVQATVSLCAPQDHLISNDDASYGENDTTIGK